MPFPSSNTKVQKPEKIHKVLAGDWVKAKGKGKGAGAGYTCCTTRGQDFFLVNNKLVLQDNEYSKHRQGMSSATQHGSCHYVQVSLQRPQTYSQPASQPARQGLKKKKRQKNKNKTKPNHTYPKRTAKPTEVIYKKK